MTSEEEEADATADNKVEQEPIGTELPRWDANKVPSTSATTPAVGGTRANNAYTIGACIIASSGALLFGLDVGITGGVTAMPAFLQRFFPDIYAQQQDTTVTNAYCTYDSQTLALFTSSFFLAGMISSLVASWLTSQRGRRASMALGALLYIVGSALSTGAVGTAMLIIGRILNGLGCGFVNQAVPTYLAELPPPSSRGALQTLFQVCVNLGVVIAGIINYFVSSLDYGWRISLGVFLVPAVVLLIGCVFLPESPAFLLSTGKTEEARLTLQKLRGKDASIEQEFDAITYDVQVALQSGSESQQLRLLLSRPYRGELTVASLIAFFSQFTGINSMLYYAPELFNSLGSGTQGSLLSAIAVNIVLLAGSITSLFIIDRIGRRPLLITGGLVMFIFQFATSLVFLFNFNPFDTNAMPSSTTNGILALICLFTYSFGWSWGPLGWLVPVESQSQATRSAGATASVFVNFAAVFITTQAFLPMLCTMQWGTFLFFAAFDIVMTLFAWKLLPETKGVPADRIRGLFQNHWYWRKHAADY